MRLFIAIVVPPGVVSALDSQLVASRAAWPGLRWTTPGAWHLTLAFLGEVEEPLVPRVSARLATAARRHSPLGLSVATAGAFPSAARAAVVWAGVRGDRLALARLAASVAAGARRAGITTGEEGRRYRPHLTLARCREPTDVRPLVTGLASLASGAWLAGDIHLIRSQLGPEPRYSTLGSWPLRREDR